MSNSSAPGGVERDQQPGLCVPRLTPLPLPPQPARIRNSRQKPTCSCLTNPPHPPCPHAIHESESSPQRFSASRSYRPHLLICVLLLLLSLVTLIYLSIHISVLSKKLTRAQRDRNPSSSSDPKPKPSSPQSVPAKESFSPETYRASWTTAQADPNLTPLEYDVVEPVMDENVQRGQNWTIIFLHGLGDHNSSNGYQWRSYLLSNLSIISSSQLKALGSLSGLRFIFPKATNLPISVYENEIRPAWFDIHDWNDLNHLEDEIGLRESCLKISKIIEDQISLGFMKMENTILAGFSQGAVMSLLLTLALPQPPFATLMLSGYLPLPFRLPLFIKPNSNSQNLKSSLYWLHGLQDPTLTYNSARSGFRLLQSILSSSFKRMKFKGFPDLDHSFDLNEIRIVTNWIQEIVLDQSDGMFDDDFDNALVPENEMDNLI